MTLVQPPVHAPTALALVGSLLVRTRGAMRPVPCRPRPWRQRHELPGCSCAASMKSDLWRRGCGQKSHGGDEHSCVHLANVEPPTCGVSCRCLVAAATSHRDRAASMAAPLCACPGCDWSGTRGQRRGGRWCTRPGTPRAASRCIVTASPSPAMPCGVIATAGSCCRTRAGRRIRRLLCDPWSGFGNSIRACCCPGTEPQPGSLRFRTDRPDKCGRRPRDGRLLGR